MTIQPGKCAIALAVSVALLWIICSALVWLTPAMMMSMTESMLHAELAHVNWKMSLSGVVAGLVIWTFFAAVMGGLFAGIYNRLVSTNTEE